MAEMSVVQQLHDIHLPSPVSMWPLAIGWWLLFISLVLMLFIAWKGYAYWMQKRIQRLFLRQCQLIKQQYEQDQNATLALQSLNFLLKKAALHFYPREQVAALHGETWLDFLQKTSKHLDIQSVRELFGESIYQKQVHLDIRSGFVMVKHWIEQQRKPCMN